MAKVFDLDALEFVETTEPFVFKFGGEEFTIAAHYDPRIFRLARNGDLSSALERMIGKEQFDRLDQIDQPFDERHMDAVFNAWATHDVTTVGDAKASSSSSKSTGRPSKRTSNGSTTSRSQRSSSIELPGSSSTGGDSEA
jgi:hypothetical protein